MAPEPEVAPSEASPAPESALAMEARVLRLALQQLRQENDPETALDTLDEYAAGFAVSRLRAEAAVVRVDALMALDRPKDALSVLDRLELERSRAHAVLRGELRAAHGRCRDALSDFEMGGPHMTDEVGARALYGRAACRAQLGQHGSARADLEQYLRRFPNGASAAEARHALGR